MFLLLLLLRPTDHVLDGLPLNVLHGDVVTDPVEPDLVRRHDVRVIDARGEARLLEKHRQKFFVRREIGAQVLQYLELVEPPGTLRYTQIRRSHPAASKLGDGGDICPVSALIPRIWKLVMVARSLPAFQLGSDPGLMWIIRGTDAKPLRYRLSWPPKNRHTFLCRVAARAAPCSSPTSASSVSRVHGESTGRAARTRRRPTTRPRSSQRVTMCSSMCSRPCRQSSSSR